MKTWLLLDCNYLCYRCHYTMGELSYGGDTTGVIYGFLKEVQYLQKDHSTPNVAFCFDHGRTKRASLLPTYKESRKKRRREASEEEKRQHKDLRRQIVALKMEILEEIGYRNVFYQDGYEADDVIASITKRLPEDQRAVIVSSDQDLFQLISNRVSVWNPQQQNMLTLSGFRAKYRIDPAMWPDVKAIAGCGSDDVKGLKGIGELTAIKFLRRELKQDSKAYKRITTEGATIWQHNLDIVKLPFPGVETFELQKDEIDLEGWYRVADRFGMKSLKKLAPLRPRGIRDSSRQKKRSKGRV